MSIETSKEGQKDKQINRKKDRQEKERKLAKVKYVPKTSYKTQ